MSEYPHNAFPEPRGGGCLPGMTLRDWFAGQALAEAMKITYRADPRTMTEKAENFAAGMAYKLADAMLKERKNHE